VSKPAAKAILGTITALALALGAGAAEATRAREAAVARWKAIEIAGPANEAEEAVLGRGISLAFDGTALFVADAQDCAVKVFARDGRFLRSFGRKGSGPGEFSFPSGVAAAGGKVLVADKLNSRILFFDPEGRPAGGFPVKFLPDRVYALAADAVLVTGNATGKRKGEALLHIFDAAGRPRWEGLEAAVSGDPTYDAFRNMILVCPAGGGDFYVVFRSGGRTVLRFSSRGTLLAEIAVDGRFRSRPLDLPFKSGRKRLAGFCWAASSDRGRLYLSAPAPVDGGKDLGPGREISVVDSGGRLMAVIDLGRAVHRFAVEGDRVFAVDDEGELRIFEVVR